ncbi:CG32750, partial [Drosophila busckii]
MWKFLMGLLLLCSLVLVKGQITKSYYTAGVVEFRPTVQGGSSSEMLQQNLDAYLQLIEQANGEADILVFPEGTLNNPLQLTRVPQLTHNDSICSEAIAQQHRVEPFMQKLACAALRARSYLVINVQEREDCDIKTQRDCPSRGYLLFNTNVVFDRSGAIVSRYRKWNLYLAPEMNRTESADYGAFKTDLGIVFGHFICFDMLFYTPATELIERFEIRNIIATNMFNSELPFLTASQLQQGWAWGSEVNLLAAGASLPARGISGSGIYAGKRGAIVRHMVGNATVGERRLLLARVPIYPNIISGDVSFDVARPGPAQQMLPLLQQQAANFRSQPLQLQNSSLQQIKLCEQQLCCYFNVSLQLPPAQQLKQLPYQYRAALFAGNRSYEQDQRSSLRLCAIVACLNDEPASCGKLHAADLANAPRLQFNALNVSGEFIPYRRRLLMPSTLSYSLYALQPSEMSWQQHFELFKPTRIDMQLLQPHSQLLTFGIYGNYFDEHYKGKAAGRTALSGWLLSCALLSPLLLLMLIGK